MPVTRARTEQIRQIPKKSLLTVHGSPSHSTSASDRVTKLVGPHGVPARLGTIQNEKFFWVTMFQRSDSDHPCVPLISKDWPVTERSEARTFGTAVSEARDSVAWDFVRGCREQSK